VEGCATLNSVERPHDQLAIALDEANRTGRIKRGDYALVVMFGRGLAWASTVINW
jgi:3-oxoacyl-[acyl-carrier-protein] synthase III